MSPHSYLLHTRILKPRMSSSQTIVTLMNISRQINIYIGIPVFIIGVIGGVSTIIVFLSLETFRRNSCAFYLTVMSFVNLGQLLTGLLSRITINASFVDWTQLSLFYCKFRMYFLVVCTTTSMLCLTLATIDQFLATCRSPYLQRWSDLRLSRLFSSLSIIFGIGTSIPCLIYYDHQFSLTTGRTICSATNPFFLQLNIYFYRLALSNILPLFVTLVFGLLTYRNVQQIAYRTVPLVRRELDKQLTVMILVQDACTFFMILPIAILGLISLDTNITGNPLSDAQFQLANVIAVMLYYIYFSVRKKIFQIRDRALSIC